MGKDKKKKETAASEEVKEEQAAEAEPKTAPEEKTAEEPKAEETRVVPVDQYLRLMAEYDNFRKRSQKEKDELTPLVRAETVKGFLPVYDNLVRALAQTTEDEAYRKGVEMIMKQFCSTMEKLGVTEIEALGKTFDPRFHNAVMHTDDETKGENEIVEVFQTGFLMGEKVIRFAMVKVAN